MYVEKIPVIIKTFALDWDYLNNGFKKVSDTLYTGNVKFVAYLSDIEGFCYDTRDIVYEDRYFIKLSKKANKEDFLKLLDSFEKFYHDSIKSLKNLNHSLYFVSEEDILDRNKLSEIIQEVNGLFIRWPALFPVNMNLKNKTKKPLYNGSFYLTIFEKSKIGLYDNYILKNKIKFKISEFTSYEEFSEKMDIMCDRWDTFRKIPDDEKKELFTLLFKK